MSEYKLVDRTKIIETRTVPLANSTAQRIAKKRMNAPTVVWIMVAT